MHQVHLETLRQSPSLIAAWSLPWTIRGSSMWATLSGGIVNAILDPLFIFGFGWNIEGAAIASVIARFSVLFFSLYPLIRSHQLVALPSMVQWRLNIRPIIAIAIPAIITNTATPIGNAIVTTGIAQYGEDFVAGFAVIGRLTPVCFAVIFALSGAVGSEKCPRHSLPQQVKLSPGD